MNKIYIHGHMTKDPDLRQTQTGKNVCLFTVAVNDEYNKETAYFFNCVAWNKLAETISTYTSKGSEIIVIGKMASRQYEKDGAKHTVWELIADSFEFCGSKSKDKESAPYKLSDPEEPDGYLPF